jgi:hypothetical protein
MRESAIWEAIYLWNNPESCEVDFLVKLGIELQDAQAIVVLLKYI